MARTRYLKPAFFQNDKLAELSPWHRLLFAGLWTLADSSGRLEDRPKRIKGQLFPFDDVDVDQLLSDLSAGGDSFVVRYQVSGVAYIAIPKFLSHQRPHGKEPESTIPAPETVKTGEKNESRGKVGASPTKSASSPTLMGNGEWGTLEPLMGNGGRGTVDGERAPARPAAVEPRGDFGQSILGAHRGHGWCNDRGLCVPRVLYDELLQRFGVDRQPEFRAWMGMVIDGLGETVPGESVWVFWRSRFEAWQGQSVTKAVPRPELGSWRDECDRDHGGTCGNQHFHHARSQAVSA